MKKILNKKMRFIVRTEMISGVGIAKELPNYLEGYGFKNIALVVDKGLYENNEIGKIN